MQTKLGSFVEAWGNILIGFSLNFGMNMLVLPMFGFTSLTAGKNFTIGLLYTVVSLARSYILRRYFNGLKFFEVKEYDGPPGYGPNDPPVVLPPGAKWVPVSDLDLGRAK